MKVNTTLTKSVAEKEMCWRKASVLESKLQLKKQKRVWTVANTEKVSASYQTIKTFFMVLGNLSFILPHKWVFFLSLI